MKKVLVVHYSQTGQMSSVVDSICRAMQSDEISVSHERLRTRDEYPFPWPFLRFLDVFPESVYLDPPALMPLSVDAEADFDLVVIAYQVWYLSPSLPITAFIKSPAGRRLLAGRPVITVIACRNMWLMAQEKMKQMLRDAGAKLLDNVALVDSQSALVTFITTPRWLLTGNKGAPGGIFPPAGVAQRDINRAARFGKAIACALHDDLEKRGQPLLRGLEAARTDTRLIASERIGHRSFMIWGKLLRKIGPQGDPLRRVVLVIYAVFLVTMIVTVVPVTMALNFLLRPVFKQGLERDREYFEAPSGSANDRMREFLHDQ
jgi:hypothetical protein